MEAWLKGRIRAIAGTGFVRSTSEQRSTSDVSTMLSRITDPIAKAEFRASFLDKLRFLDEKTKSVAASRTCSREPLMCWTRLFPALPRLIWSSVLLPKIPACNSASFGAARCSHSAVCCELFVSGKIRCHDLDVDLQSLESFLGFMGWLPRSVYILSLVWTVGADERWQKFALISPAQRKLQAGQCIPTVSSLSSLRVFILNTTARSPPAQPRLLHYANPADRRSL